MNFKLKIDLSNLKQIIWPVVFIYVLKMLNLLEAKPAFIVYVLILCYLIVYLGKIIIPKIYGMKFYIFFIIYSSIIGIVLYNMRNVVRDLFYVLPTVVLIIIGYYLYPFYGKKFCIYRTIVFCGAMLSTYTFFTMLQKPSVMSNFSDIRTVFSSFCYEVLIAFLVLFASMIVSKKRLFKRWVEIFCMLIMLGHLILSLARSVWIQMIIGCIVILILDAYYNNKIKKIFTIFMKITLIASVLLLLLVYVAPKSITEEFTSKFERTSEELDSDQEFNSTEDAMNNWRGYENQSAIKQWNESFVFVTVFGGGLGKGIHLELIPFTWSEMVEDSEIPLLHNGYYTILIKGGIVGLLSFVWLMLANVFAGLRLLKKRNYLRMELILLVSICVNFMVQTYVVRGPVSQDANITWCLLVGWINAQITQSE